MFEGGETVLPLPILDQNVRDRLRALGPGDGLAEFAPVRALWVARAQKNQPKAWKFGRREKNSAPPIFLIPIGRGIQPIATEAFRAGKEFGRRHFGHFRQDQNSADRFDGIPAGFFLRQNVRLHSFPSGFILLPAELFRGALKSARARPE